MENLYFYNSIVSAEKKNWHDYLKERGAEPYRDDDTEGYLLKNKDGLSWWVIKEDFENKYISNDNLPFYMALYALTSLSGYHIARKSWRERGEDKIVHITNLSTSYDFTFSKSLTLFYPSTKNIVIGWIPSSEDLFAEDWFLGLSKW